MIRISGGTFRMGSDRHYREEAPVRHVHVDPFRMDPCTVTNAEFAAFVAATGYVTIAERPLNPADYPGAKPELLVPGACWRHPEGPGSDLSGRASHPVVQVAFEDAAAYAAWAGKELPTEAEWECAARGGLDGAAFVWGDDLAPGGKPMANTWQGPFPWRNFATDGFTGTAPVGSYPPNGFGLFDMAGNVWQWTTDWFSATNPPDAAKPCCVPENPRGAALEASYDPAQPAIRIPRKVVKGGSFLCAPSYCRRYRPAARHAQMVDTGMSHIGFRCIKREQ